MLERKYVVLSRSHMDETITYPVLVFDSYEDALDAANDFCFVGSKPEDDVAAVIYIRGSDAKTEDD